jgi:hypothetical protein
MGLDQLTEDKKKSLKNYILQLSEQGYNGRKVKRLVLKKYNVNLDFKR